MNDKESSTTMLRISAIGLATLALGSSVSVASAQTIASPRHVPSVAARSVQHRYFGTLQSVNGQLLTIQLRNGRLLHVDAARAFTAKRVSEPLFPGKPTVVDGTLGAAGVFIATAVKRGAPLATNWGLDQ